MVLYCVYCFFSFLPAGCRGSLPVLNLLSASVTKNQHFRPCKKKLCVGSKNDPYLYCDDVLYQRAKFGGDRTIRAPAVGAKIVFVCRAWSVCAWGT